MPLGNGDRLLEHKKMRRSRGWRLSLEMKPPTRISLRLLGRLALAYGDDPTPIRLSTRKAGVLIAYLAMNPEQSASREELAALLWGDCTDQQARQSLRQALALLRKELRWPHFLSADTDVVRLQPGMWSVDARDFEDLSKSCDPKGLERAARLFGGEFLSGLNIDDEGFDEWVRGQRQRIQLAAARLCETFATRPDLVADGEQAVAVAERLMALDPLREDWQRLALTLYARYRGKSEAQAQADVFAGLLQRELGVGPERDTQNLVERIRGGEIAPAASMAPPSLAAAGGPPADTQPSIPLPAPQGEHVNDAALPVAVQRLAILKQWSGRAAATALAIAAVVVAGGVFGLPDGRPVSDHPRDNASKIASNVSEHADPWQSPRLPMQRTDEKRVGQRGGLVAIVVLPFTIQGEGGERASLLADVMTDDLTNMLSRVGGFRVISRQTAMSYRGQPVDPTAISAELGVHYVLEGSAQIQQKHLRVSVELVDTKSRSRVWSGRFERVDGDLHGIHDEIVNSLGRELQIEVFQFESARDSKDPDVHELIFKGWGAINASGKSGVDALRQAEKYFTQALERDPDNPRAQNGLGAYHAHMAIQLYATDPAAHLAKAEAILRPLVDRYPDATAPHATIGLVHVAREDMKEAVRSFERSIALNPSHVLSHAQLGRALVRLARPQEGLEHIRYAMRLSPRDPAMGFYLAFAGSAELELNHYAKAIDYFDRALVLNPGQPRTSLSRIAAHALSGNMSEASAQLEQLQRARPHLSREKLIDLYAKGAPDSQLRRGIKLALAAQTADPWQSPGLAQRADSSSAQATKKAITAIAVLPFTTYGDMAGSIQVTADMVTDDLINALSRVANLRVVSRQTSFSYRGQAVDVAAIGAELGVRYVLEGSMRMHGDKLRVNVELIDPATRLPVWTTRIERDRAERHTVQDEIVGRLARELQFEIYQVESKRAPQDPDMAELNSIGWAAIFDHGTQGVDALRRAEAAFKGMQARDPHNWSAAAGLGAYHVLIGSLQLVPDWKTHLTKGEELVRQSLRERPNAANQHFYLAIIQRMRGEVQDAMESLGRCLDIAPSMAPCHAHLGHSLVWLKRPGEGLEHIRYALRLSPRDATRSHWLRFAGEAELELDHYDLAVSYLRQSAALNARQPMTLRSLAAALALAGQLDEARQRMTEVKTAAPHISDDGLLNRSKRIESTQPQLSRGLRLVLTPPS